MVTGPLSGLCRPDFLVGENILYPISGEIGMKQLVQEFVQLAIFGDLTGDLSKDFTAKPGPSQLAEQLEFTTTIDFSVTPKITFSPVPLAGLRLAEASYTGQAQRKDLHKLTVGLYVPTKGLQETARRTVLGPLSGVITPGIVSPPVREPSEAGAVRVLNELLYLKIFQFRPEVVIR